MNQRKHKFLTVPCVFLATILAVAGAYQLNGRTSSANGLYFDPGEFDFGEAEQAQALNYTFDLQNRAKFPIRIHGLHFT